MINWIKRQINKHLKSDNALIQNVIEIDTSKGSGLCDVYKNGKKTNTRMYVWDKDHVDRLVEIGEKLADEHRAKSSL